MQERLLIRYFLYCRVMNYKLRFNYCGRLRIDARFLHLT